jgi:tetratricopeptide (TPR) repeat protein
MMSECGLWQTAKRTLCGIVLAACTSLPIFSAGCSARPSESVPQHQVENSTDHVVKQAVDYFVKREYARAQGLLEQRINYLKTENKKQQETLSKTLPFHQPTPDPELSPSEQVILALSYSMNRHYDKAETTFTNLMNYFKNNPTGTIEDIDKNLSEFFKTENYKSAEKLAASGTGMYPKMNAVVGFLKFARKDYEGARTYFKRAIPHFWESTVQEYRVAFNVMLVEAARKGTDNATIIEYAKMVNTLYSLKGKEETQTKN